MEWQWAMLLIMGVFFLLMTLGLPVAFSLMFTAAMGSYIWWNGQAGLELLTISFGESLTRFIFLPVPLFVLMGELLSKSGIAMNMIDTVDDWLGHLPGRLSLIAVGTGLIISTLTGVGSATIAILGGELVPEMEKRGYKKSMSLGPILGSSSLATMIPPSGLAVLIAAVGEISVGSLLIAIIVPGLMMAVTYAIYIITRCKLQPEIAPPYSPPPVPISKKIVKTIKTVMPIGLVFFLVTGVIFFGIATPSEAAATGVLGVIIMCVYYRRLTWKVLIDSLYATTRITLMVFLVIVSAEAFSRILAFSGITQGLVSAAFGLPMSSIWLICVILVLVIILGMFMPVIAMMMIAIPMCMPIVRALGFSDVWFGVLIILTLEMGVISPPYGTDLFIMKHVAPPDTTIRDVYTASIPFLICDIVVLTMLTFIPNIVLWLPDLMR